MRGYIILQKHQIVNSSFVDGYLKLPPTKADISFEEAILLHDFFPAFIAIYCSALQPTYMAGNFRQILAILPIKKQKAEYATYQVEHLNFTALSTKYIDKLEFTLASHDGEEIDFVSKLPVILQLKIDLNTNNIN